MNGAELQKQLNEALEESAKAFKELTQKQIDFAINEIHRTRQQLNDMLQKHAMADGSFKKTRIQAILRDLDTVEKRITENGMNAIESITKQTSALVANKRQGTLENLLGTNAIDGVQFNRLPENVFRYVSTRFAADGLLLSDRVWKLSGQLRDELGSTIRTGILQGKNLSTMIADVRRVYDNDTWKIRRLVLTESAIAYRTADMYVAQQSKVVKGLKIHRGRANRPDHACTILSQQDNYGWGAGVFKPDDTAIMNPHPNCTSWLEYVLIEDVASVTKQKPAGSTKGSAGSGSQPGAGKPKFNAPPLVNPKAPKPGTLPKYKDPAVDPREALAACRNYKEFESFADVHLGIKHVSFKDFDDMNLKQFNLMMLNMKQEFPEAFGWGIKRVGTCQDAMAAKYEMQMTATIEHNLKKPGGYWNKKWTAAADDVERAAIKQELRDDIVKNKLVTKGKVDGGTNAFAYNNCTGHYETLNGIYINKTNSKNFTAFNESKAAAEKSKWSAIGSARGTYVHEFGHTLDYWLESNGRAGFADQFWASVSKQDKTWWADNISRYGSTNRREMFAELFSEYKLHPNPRPMAKHFGTLLEDEIKRHRIAVAKKGI